MSAGDTVCTGWLVKSPPERKLQRYAWRKRWFVLRRGRMSGNPDVLEYYRNKHSSKPIRAIDLNECAVWKHAGPGFIRKEFQNHFVFTVKTISRTYYLVAKTEVEMLVWIHSICEVCNLVNAEDGTDSAESHYRSPSSSLQPSSASSLHTAPTVSSSLPRDDPRTNTVATEKTRSESEYVNSLPDYVILSNCETGRPHHASLPTRCDSWSNSDRMSGQTSYDDVFVDYLMPPSPRCLGYHGKECQHKLATKSQATLTRSRNFSGPYKNLPPSLFVETSLNSTVDVDKNRGSLPYGARGLDTMYNTPPPRPPKPSHLLEQRQEEQPRCGHSICKRPECTTTPRRTSLPGLDNMKTSKADVEGQSKHQEKRHSLNLPCKFSTAYPKASSHDDDNDGYIPMGPVPALPCSKPQCNSDDYVPMNRGCIASPLPMLPANMEPPPVNRDLKPERKARLPHLDQNSLSTFRGHATLTRTHTAPCNRTNFFPQERNTISSARYYANSASRKDDDAYVQMYGHRIASSVSSSGTMTSKKKCSLDYLALDFNTVSPVPAQKKPSEDYKVDYVQVDEQKTQALQNTKQEWSDERQSRVLGKKLWEKGSICTR
ncbi:GRB2-associated-binding protein 3 isoform X2 [Rousettus aegyptiacus]|uniref:GRB2-associated-binding protein 3 isoform X2 n=1 Tax=Rousettus aegyptiacus TaxID=9407 RepID=UPI00168D6991|nr:GRB2-associated-binding protein 3 isoform X2 [Rousettus aegyptiacus]